jgi:chemotaxis signal transduction protein
MLEDFAADLRRTFDRSFAEPPRDAPGPTVDLLALRLGPDPYAIRLEEISAVVSDKRVTPLPGSPPELLGLAGFRGELVPVYDLGLLLGYPRLQDGTHCLVLTSATPRIGLAFSELDAYLRVAPEQVLTEPGGNAMLGSDHDRRSILQLLTLRAMISKRVRPGGLEEEHA